MEGYEYPLIEIDTQPILEKLAEIVNNQLSHAEKVSESSKVFDENQKLMLEDFEVLRENQSLMIIGYDTLNQRLKNQNIGTMVIVLVLGILVGIGFVSFLKGGKK